MQVIQCQICQVTNEETAQFCRECGGRLQTPAPVAGHAGASSGFEDAAPPQVTAEPPKRQRLHSPILGGGTIGDEDPPPSFQRVKSGQSGANHGPDPSQSGTGGQRRGGLRSPLLGGDDDDMDEPDIAPRGKAFGGFGGGGKGKKTEFPHRHHDADEHQNAEPSQSSQAGGQKNTGARGGLRSPLLGGGAGDADYSGGYDDDAGRGPGKQQGKSGRLRSPILGGGGGDYYEDEIFDDEVEEIDDPTVLRSPLLAVRTPKAHNQPAPVVNNSPMPGPANASIPLPIPVGEPKAAPFVQGPYTQASGGNAPNFAVKNPPLPAPQQPLQQEAGNVQGGPNYAAFPPNPGSQGNQIGIVPQAPSQAPAYSPPPAPAAPPGTPAGNGNAGSAADGQYNYGVNNAAPGYQAPLPKPPLPQSPSASASVPALPASTSSMPRPNQQALPPTNFDAGSESSTPARATGTRMPAADQSESGSDMPKARGMRGSKLLGDVSDDPIGPLDRRARFADRRSKGTGHSMAAVDDDDQDVPFSKGGRSSMQSGMSSAPANPMAPILMALAVVALLAKGYYMSTYLGNPNLLTTALPATIDQLTSMLVLVGIILFAMKASQKS
ncbi:MAG: hypothetical protein KGS72_03600 [Cyanobacteria bacterium REEB67]|nr:hypothetical protein [Cyanobacteria bacterium REEB67]